jgi:hypothetical protein
MTASLRVEPYTSAYEGVWNDFVAQSKNGTFLFERGYMEYHSDRFTDSSLLFLENESIVAVLPATRRGPSIESHGGLTYGGFALSPQSGSALMLELFETLVRWSRDNGVATIVYKPVPHIYHTIPAEEDRYALFLAGAVITRSGILAVIDARMKLPMQERRRRQIRKAASRGIVVRETDDLATYWRILAERLRQRYNSAPVHTAEEIARLRARFPHNIRLFAAFDGDEMLGGVLVFESSNVARAQYIVASDAGRDIGALDLVFQSLLADVFPHKRYFDFGTSDEQGGLHLNRSLLEQKEGFGSRAVALETFTIDVDAVDLTRLRADRA